MRLLLSISLLIISWNTLAVPSQVTDIQILQPTQQSVRLIFDLTAPVSHNVFTLTAPSRLVVDLKNAVLVKNMEMMTVNNSLIEKVRGAVHSDNDLRLVLDLTGSVHTKSFLLKPTGKTGHRLVIEISASQRSRTVSLSASFNNALANLSSNLLPATVPTITVVPPPSTSPSTPKEGIATREILVAIDAGHGGIDSGAIGQSGTFEKNVVLAVAKELATLIDNEPGMRPVLIRNDDYFLELRRRVELAREYQADLFISIHADAYPGSNRVNGSSVYMLSPSGVSSEAAQWLADKENSADLLGGISLQDKDELLASVLINLLQTGTLEASARVGNSVLKALKQIGSNHFNSVQQANFMVLRSPEIPSILVETAFLSNPEDEKKLNDPDYRLQVAQAILAGVREYFAAHPPINKVIARR